MVEAGKGRVLGGLQGGHEKLPDDWVTTAIVIRETGRRVFGVSPGQTTDDRDSVVG